jgi:hypothetical protein
MPATGTPSSFDQRHRIARVVAMAVGHEDVGRAADRLRPSLRRKHWVSGQPGVDQQDAIGYLDPEAGMAEPCDLHQFLP